MPSHRRPSAPPPPPSSYNSFAVGSPPSSSSGSSSKLHRMLSSRRGSKHSPAVEAVPGEFGALPEGTDGDEQEETLKGGGGEGKGKGKNKGIGRKTSKLFGGGGGGTGGGRRGSAGDTLDAPPRRPALSRSSTGSASPATHQPAFGGDLGAGGADDDAVLVDDLTPGLASTSLSTSPSSVPRFSDFPSRLSGWFGLNNANAHSPMHASSPTPTHFSDHSYTSSVPVPMPHPHPRTSLDAPAPSSSPSSSPARSKTANFFSGIRHRAGVDKAMQFFLDGDATPDKSPEPLWVLGIEHEGYQERASPSPHHHSHYHHSNGHSHTSKPSISISSPPPPNGRTSPPQQRTRASSRAATYRAALSAIPTGSAGFSSTSTKALSSIFSQSPSALSHLPSTPAPAIEPPPPPTISGWPAAFFEDFASRVWCTYRSGYAPIRADDPQLADLELPGAAEWENGGGSAKRGWLKRKEYTSDQGWGCMLRTSQSLLANALIVLELGRNWRRPSPHPRAPPSTPQALHAELTSYATFVRILTYFMDDPSPLCPFSVHRMALVGKSLGKEIGEWFGPSTAAGAIKHLAHAYPAAGISVSVATDSVVFRSDVYAASHIGAPVPSRHPALSWGGRPVLVLIGIRLGLDGVHPRYQEALKALFSFPQSVGIAGGRPSQSYYFIGYQGNSLVYVDPHITRPSIPFRPPAPPGAPGTGMSSSQSDSALSSNSASTSTTQDERTPPRRPAKGGRRKHSILSGGGGSSSTHNSGKTKRHPSRSASLQSWQSDWGTASSRSSISGGGGGGGGGRDSYSSPPGSPLSRATFPPLSSPVSEAAPSPSSSRSVSPLPTPRPDSGAFPNEPFAPPLLDPVTEWYATAYSQAELATFFCDKPRKMSLASMDPSMLCGFLVKDEADWLNFVSRVGQLSEPIFSIQEEPPRFDSDDEGLRSFSEPDADSLDDGRSMSAEAEEDDDDADPEEEDWVVNSNSNAAAPSPSPAAATRATAEQVEDDDDNDDDDRSSSSRGGLALPQPTSPREDQPLAGRHERSPTVRPQHRRAESEATVSAGGSGPRRLSTSPSPSPSPVRVPAPAPLSREKEKEVLVADDEDDF